MRIKLLVNLGALVIAIAAFLTLAPTKLSSQQGATVQVDADDIGGLVTSAKGPKAASG